MKLRTPNPYFPRSGPLREAAARRDRLLLESDWTQAADSGLTPLQRTAWADWRAKLAKVDLATNNRTWPKAPTETKMRALALAEDRPASLDISIDWRNLL